MAAVAVPATVGVKEELEKRCALAARKSEARGSGAALGVRTCATLKSRCGLFLDHFGSFLVVGLSLVG